MIIFSMSNYFKNKTVNFVIFITMQLWIIRCCFSYVRPTTRCNIIPFLIPKLSDLHFHNNTCINIFFPGPFVLTESIFYKKISFIYIIFIQMKGLHITFITHD